MSQLADEHGGPYKSFPVDMMRYGMGGTADWGSLCGTLNGSAALIGLFTEKEDEIKICVDELFLWYEQTELPIYNPQRSTSNIEIPKSLSLSVLCHVSVTKWCKISGHKISSKPQKERCRRLAADTARKTVEILNAQIAGQFSKTRQFNKITSQCKSCHTKGSELQNSRGKMSCTQCHSLQPDNHPQVL
jgi:NADH pyrophosphatase NudC (nudix superfamily)